MRYLCAALFLLAGIGTAAAEIRINVSRYEDGKLTIKGETAPDRTVTLDDKFKTKSDGGGFFKFKLDYKPSTCMGDIRAGTDVYSAVIAGCLDAGVGDDALPVSATATH